MTLPDLLKSGSKWLLDTMFPKNFTCDICSEESFNGTNICDNCLKDLNLNNQNTCPVCGRKTFRPEICMECKSDAPLFKKAASPFLYTGASSALIGKYKKSKPYLKEYFADQMAPLLKDFPPIDGIVYVPMTKKAERRRGYNQSKLLAYALKKRTGIAVFDDVLEKRKDTFDQKSLSQRERAENLKGCFHVHRRKFCQNKSLLLVDDVLTTGATANEICRILYGAGAYKVYLLTIASVPFSQQTKKADPTKTE